MDLIDGSSTYKLLKNDQAVNLNGMGQKSTPIRLRPFGMLREQWQQRRGLEVLLTGQEVYRGKFRVWGTDNSGKIIDMTDWKTGEQMMSLGYEDVFGPDIF